MIRILYLSQAIPTVTDTQVRDILESSRRNNPAIGITGVLVHGGGTFMQVLEGPEASTLRLYVKILDDRKHGNCRIIHISPASERMFPTWSMGEIKSDPLQFQHLAALRAHRVESIQTKAFTSVMREFLWLLNTVQPDGAR